MKKISRLFFLCFCLPTGVLSWWGYRTFEQEKKEQEWVQKVKQEQIDIWFQQLSSQLQLWEWQLGGGGLPAVIPPEWAFLVKVPLEKQKPQDWIVQALPDKPYPLRQSKTFLIEVLEQFIKDKGGLSQPFLMRIPKNQTGLEEWLAWVWRKPNAWWIMGVEPSFLAPPWKHLLGPEEALSWVNREGRGLWHSDATPSWTLLKIQGMPQTIKEALKEAAPPPASPFFVALDQGQTQAVLKQWAPYPLFVILETKRETKGFLLWRNFASSFLFLVVLELLFGYVYFNAFQKQEQENKRKQWFQRWEEQKKREQAALGTPSIRVLGRGRVDGTGLHSSS